ncbi:MAG: RDD family protein [Polyangiales bacterium]
MSERKLQLTTPEGVRLPLVLATLSERAFALCIDFGILFGSIIALLVGVLFALPGEHIATDTKNLLLAFTLLALFFLRYGYFAFFEARFQGVTPGKRLLGLRVVSRDGGGLSLEAVVARNILRDFEIFLPLALLFADETPFGPSPTWLRWLSGGWTLVMVGLPWLHPERLRTGDLLAGTAVVRTPSAPLLADQAARRSLTAWHFRPEQLAIYGEHELETLARVLRRAEEEDAGNLDLHAIASTIAGKIGHPPADVTRDPLRFLRAFYRAQRAALEKHALFGRRKADKLSATRHEPR